MGHTLKPSGPHKHVHVHICKHPDRHIHPYPCGLRLGLKRACSQPYSPQAHSPHRASHMKPPPHTHTLTLKHAVSAHSLLCNPWEGPSLKLQLKSFLSLPSDTLNSPLWERSFTVGQVSPCSLTPSTFCDQSRPRDTLALCSLKREDQGPCLHPPHSQCLRAGDFGGSRLQGLSKLSHQKRKPAFAL